MSDPEWEQVKSWGADLMGTGEERKKIKHMSELDRETILAERRKKLDELEERHILKKR